MNEQSEKPIGIVMKIDFYKIITGIPGFILFSVIIFLFVQPTDVFNPLIEHISNLFEILDWKYKFLIGLFFFAIFVTYIFLDRILSSKVKKFTDYFEQKGKNQ